MSHYLHKIFTLSVFVTVQECIYNIYKASFSPGSVQHLVYRPFKGDTTTPGEVLRHEAER
jgi:hypothetical protein